ncbi:MAG: GWxTD domain-containing protein [bacterium]|nr:GWxTD domain-containing protein [bacterium]
MKAPKRATSFVLISIFFIIFFSYTAYSQEFDWWEANKPETLYLTQLALADSMRFLNEFEYPFILVLSNDENGEYSKIVSQYDKKFYIRDYLKRHDENPLLPVNYWLLEYLGRYEHVRREFATEEPPYFDVRGEFYIKYGKPWRRFEDKGGYKESWFIKYRSNPGIRSQTVINENGYATKVKNSKLEGLLGIGLGSGIAQSAESGFKIMQNESWAYYDDKNNFFVHFAKDGKTWKHIDRLDKVMVDRRGSKLRLHWVDLVKERDMLGGLYSMMYDEIEWMEDLFKDVLTLSTNQVEDAVDFIMPDNARQSMLNFAPGGSVDNLKTQEEYSEKAYLARAVPNVSTRFDELSQLDFDYNISQFRNPDGRTRIELQLLAPINDMLRQRPNVNLPDSIAVEFQFLARNENFDQLFNVPLSASFEYQKVLDAGLPNAVSTVTFPVKPMKGDLTMQVKDPVSLKMGYKKVPFNVRDFSGKSLAVSDIQFYMQPQNDLQRELLPIIEVGEFEVTPYPYTDFASLLPITCYFEIYNIMNAGIISEYDIDISVTRIELSLFERLKKLLRKPEGYTMSLERTRQVDGNDASELLEFDISNLRKGRYVLEVTITDKLNKEITAKSSRTIKIVRF